MPFNSQNAVEYGRQGGLASVAARYTGLSLLFNYLGNEGARGYCDMLALQREGVEFTKDQKEFMDRCERLMEHIAPKLARSELTGKDGERLQINGFQFVKNEFLGNDEKKQIDTP